MNPLIIEKSIRQLKKMFFTRAAGRHGNMLTLDHSDSPLHSARETCKILLKPVHFLKIILYGDILSMFQENTV